MRKTDDYVLVSRIMTKAKLLTNMSKISNTLELYPGLFKDKCDYGLRYTTLNDEKGARFVIEATKESISIEISSNTSPLYFMKEGLLRLLSLIAILHDDYEVGIEGLYPYLTYVLMNVEPCKFTKNVTNVREDTDIILAKRILKLIRKNEDYEKLLKTERNNFVKVLSKLIEEKYTHKSRVEEISESIGVDVADVDEAVQKLIKDGYRKLPSGRDSFDLVRI